MPAKPGRRRRSAVRFALAVVRRLMTSKLCRGTAKAGRARTTRAPGGGTGYNLRCAGHAGRSCVEPGGGQRRWPGSGRISGRSVTHATSGVDPPGYLQSARSAANYRGAFYFSASLANSAYSRDAWRGRPRGCSALSRPNAAAVRTRHAGVPNGAPRTTLCRTASSSASVSGRFTRAVQFRGSATGDAVNSALR
jgi:hypothetical protein